MILRVDKDTSGQGMIAVETNQQANKTFSVPIEFLLR